MDHLPVPITIAGLKSQARKLKKESGCKHGHAIEIVAKSMGFKSYAAARKWLGDHGEN